MKDRLIKLCAYGFPVFTGLFGYVLGRLYNSEKIQKLTEDYYEVNTQLEIERIETTNHYKELIDFLKNGTVDPMKSEITYSEYCKMYNDPENSDKDPMTYENYLKTLKGY